jgi:hypothetical protein
MIPPIEYAPFDQNGFAGEEEELRQMPKPDLRFLRSI